MINGLSPQVPVMFSCRIFCVSPSGYYRWKSSLTEKKFSKRQKTYRRIKEIFYMSKKTYGSPRVFKELKAENIGISENTVAAYMRHMGLSATLKKRFRINTTDSNHKGPIAPRRFKSEEALPSKPYEVLAGDITYIKINGKFVYLAVVMDLFNRQILGWSLSDSLASDLVVSAMRDALEYCDPNTKIIFHSDRGSQYASKVFLDLLELKRVIPSMSRKGNCYDNCFVESWFKSFKTELIYRNTFIDKQDLRSNIFWYIEAWYNLRRRHSSLDYQSPIDYKNSRERV